MQNQFRVVSDVQGTNKFFMFLEILPYEMMRHNIVCSDTTVTLTQIHR